MAPAPAVERRDIDADHPSALIVTEPYSRCNTGRLTTRYRYYCRELALLVLEHGYQHLQLSLRIVYSVNASCARWLARHSSSSRHPAVLLHLLKASLQQLRQTAQRVLRPIGRVLSQLVSIKIRISTNDDLVEQGVASARVHSAVSLLFGAIRFRMHSCLQLSAPSRQPQLLPGISLISPATSPYPCSSPRKHRNRHTQGAGRASCSQSPSISPQPSPRLMSRISNHQQLSSSGSQPLSAADNEVHVLCSSELRSAILFFLQHHSSTNGQEFVLLRSQNDSSSCNTPRRTPAASTAGDCNAEDVVSSSWQSYKCRRREPDAVRDSAGPAVTVQHDANGNTPLRHVPKGSPMRKHQSHGHCQPRSVDSNRLTQSMDARSYSSSSNATDSNDFSFTTNGRNGSIQETQDPQPEPAAPISTCSRSSWSAGSTGTGSNALVRSRTAELFAQTGRNSVSSDGNHVGDAVIAVSTAQVIGRLASSRHKSCPDNPTSTAPANLFEPPSAGAGQGMSRDRVQWPRAAACSAVGLLDPNLAPLMSYRRSKCGGRRGGSTTYPQYSMYADNPASQQQQHQQQHKALLPACPTGSQQPAYIGKEYKPVRSPSPIATPARHGVRRSSSAKKLLPPPPFVLVAPQK